MSLSTTPIKAARWAKAVSFWIMAGRPERSDEDVARVLEICRGCDRFENGSCNECGCHVTTGPAVFNKARMATEFCRLEKW